MNKTVTPTAAVVRSFFRADERRIARLPEAARKTVQPGARGQIHPAAVKAYNKGRKVERHYLVGNTKAANEARAAERAALAAKGLKVGARGPLSKEALAALKG